MSTHSMVSRSFGLLAALLATAGIAQAGTVWQTKGDGRSAEVQFSGAPESDAGGRVNVFLNGNSAFLFYEVWGNDLTSQVCTYYSDGFGNDITICTYTRFFHDSGWGEIPSTDIAFTATGAALTTTTGASFSSTRCTTDTSGPTPVTTCGPSAGGSFDLTWATNNLSAQATAGLTQYSIGTFKFDSLATTKAASAYVEGNALGRGFERAPGRLGTTKGKHVATD